jgi:hypothetical protein
MENLASKGSFTERSLTPMGNSIPKRYNTSTNSK